VTGKKGLARLIGQPPPRQYGEPHLRVRGAKLGIGGRIHQGRRDWFPASFRFRLETECRLDYFGLIIGTWWKIDSQKTAGLAVRGELGAAPSPVETTAGSCGPSGKQDGVRIRACSGRESDHSYLTGKGCHYVISTVWIKNWLVTAGRTKSAERRDKAGVQTGMATSSRQEP
jgi:hypothetical protein